MKKDEAVALALGALDQARIDLKSRTPASVCENAKLIQGRTSRGWKFTFDLPGQEEEPAHDFVSVEVYEPSGKVFIVPML